LKPQSEQQKQWSSTWAAAPVDARRAAHFAELDGETVVKAVPDLGYLHTGIEKSCEDKTYSQRITLTDRMDY